MAAIGTIRKYSGIAVGLIGISILAFVISDAFQTGQGMFNRSKLEVGVIDGEHISLQDFQARLDLELEKYKQRNQVETIDQGIRDQMRDEIWNKMQEEIIYQKEYAKLGLSFSSEELTFLVSGPNPHQAVQQFFVNPETNEFDRNQLVGFLKNMDDYPEYKEIWLDFESELAKEVKRNKYFNLVKQGLNTTSLEARNAHLAKNQFATFDYIALQLRDIPDSTIQVSDDEIQAYYNKHKNENQIEEMRSFDYLVWDVFPTKEDSVYWFSQLKNIIPDFADTKKDSSYIELHSDDRYDTLYHNPGHFNETIDHVYLTLQEDDSIIGPYFENNAYKIAKLLDRKEDTVFNYKASHILIKPKGATDQDTLDAMKKARELMAEAQGGADFTLLAMRNSEDKQSAIKGGDLGWFKDKTMVKPFMDAVKRMSKGQYAVVKSQFGAHLIKVTDNPSNTLIKVGVISKQIEPTSETFQQVYSKAVKFRSMVKNADDFENIVLENEMDKRIAPEIRPNEREVPGLPHGAALISWAYRSKQGEVSDIFDLQNMYVVAVLTEVYEEGPAPLERVRDEIKMKVINEKKNEILVQRLEEASKSTQDLNAIALALGAKVDKITNASFDMPIITGLGEEKMLTGYVFGSEKEILSKPVVGLNAVFLFILHDFSEVEIPEDLTDIKKEKESNLKGMAQYETMESLKELADIQDWRYKFF